MSQTPSKQSQNRWTHSPSRQADPKEDYLQLMVSPGQGGATLGWIDSEGRLQGSLIQFDEIEIGNLDNYIYVSNGGTYPTLQSGVDAAVALGGGVVYVTPGYRETLTQTLTIGDGTKRVIVKMAANVLITVNITDGSNAVLVNKGCGLIGESHGAAINDLTGGSVITLADGAHVNNIVATPASTDNNMFYFFEKIRINGSASATVDGAGLLILDPLNLSTVKDVLVSSVPNIGILVTAHNFTSGPLTLDNCWVEGNGIAGARPLVITGGYNAGTRGQHVIQVQGGVYNNPGTGQACIEVKDFQTAQHFMNSVTFLGVYTENDTDPSCIGFKITDSSNVNLIGCEAAALNAGAGGTAVSISETASGMTTGIQITGLRLFGPSIIGVVNSISGESIGTSSSVIQQYFYGEHGAGQRSLGPIFSFPRTLIVGQNKSQADGIADMVVIPTVPGTKPPLAVANFSNNTMFVDLISGLNTPVETGLRFSDYSTGVSVAQWRLRKAPSNDFLIQEEPANGGFGLTRLAFILSSGNGTTNINSGTGTGGVSISQAPNSGTGGFSIYGGGASPLLLGRLDTNGLIIENADASHSTTTITPAGLATFRNFADSSQFAVLDGGSSAAQDVYLALSDRGTQMWRVDKNNANTFVIVDVANSKNRLVFAQSAFSSGTGAVRLTSGESIGFRNAGNNADYVIAKGGSNTPETLTWNSQPFGPPAAFTPISTNALTANVSVTTLFTVPSSGAGLYKISAYVVESTADAVSSTLPKVQIVYTEAITNTSQTDDATATQTGNTVGTHSGGSVVINAKAGTTIQYQTTGYVSNTPATMAYSIRIKLEYLGA